MAGLRDGLQRSRELYLPEPDMTREAPARFPASNVRSLPQRAGNIGFSVHGAETQSAWKRRLGSGTTTPTETTLRAALVLRCALLHGLGGLLWAGSLTVFFLEGLDKSWLWLILLAMVIALYGVCAYWCAEHFDRVGLARWVILGGDVGALMCAWLLLGPSLILALLLPGVAVLGLLLGGRHEMVILAFVEAGALVALVLLDLVGLPHLSLHAPAALLLLVNLFGALGCLGGMIYALLSVLERSEHIGSGEHWNSAEVARVRIASDIHLRQLQEGVTTLQGVLGRAAGGDLHTRVGIKDGELGPVAAKLNDLLARQEQMFDEARQHRRLEAAVGELIALLEALHRGERVGWPAPTGTQVDRLLSLMRAPLSPRPQPRTTAKLPAAIPGASSVPEDASTNC